MTTVDYYAMSLTVEDTELYLDRSFRVGYVSGSAKLPEGCIIKGNLATIQGFSPSFYIPGVKYYYYKDMGIVDCRHSDFTKLYKVLTNTSALSKLAKLLGCNKFSASTRNVNNRVPKQVILESPTYQYLLGILNTCDETYVKATIPDEPLTPSSVNRALKRYYSKSEDASGIYKYANTVQQVRALSLLQSYTESFHSCQYYPVHMIPLAKARKAVEDGLYYLEYILCKEILEHGDFQNELYSYLQDTNTVDSTRYFTQNTDGTVKSRFTLFALDDGQVVANNFYNATMSNLEIDGNKYLPYDKYGGDGEPEDGTIYFND